MVRLLKKSFVRGVLGLTLSVSGALVQATTFDFTVANLGVSANAAYNSVSLAVDGINVDVTALTLDNNGSGTIYSSSQITGRGLGVYVTDTDRLGVLSNLSSDGDLMDGGSPSYTSSDPDEGLLFSFDHLVSFDFIDFDNWSSNDDFNLLVDGVETVVVDFSSTSSSLNGVTARGTTGFFDFSGIVGREFLFWADGSTDNFNVDSLRVTSVPTPSVLFLLGLGLFGMGVLQRRKIH